ncbi:MAG: lysylphosphatidylglycerol synthase domain-containing protein [Actinomycetota bacterium]
MRSWRSAARIAFSVLAVALLVLTVVRERVALASALQQLSVGALVSSTLLVVAGLVAQMLSWRALFAGETSAMPTLRASAQIYYVGQLGKYVPGGIWAVVAQSEIGLGHRIARARSAVVALGALAVLVVTGTGIAAAVLGLTSPDSLWSYWWALPALPLGICLLTPPVFNRLIQVALRVTHRKGTTQGIGTRSLAVSTGWALVMWALFGAHIWVLAEALGGRSSHIALTSVGAFALAWVVGLLVVIAPAGAGAREVALVLAMGSVLDRPAALVLALVSRILMVVADAVVAGAAVPDLLLRRRVTRRSEG